MTIIMLICTYDFRFLCWYLEIVENLDFVKCTLNVYYYNGNEFAIRSQTNPYKLQITHVI